GGPPAAPRTGAAGLVCPDHAALPTGAGGTVSGRPARTHRAPQEVISTPSGPGPPRGPVFPQQEQTTCDRATARFILRRRSRFSSVPVSPPRTPHFSPRATASSAHSVRTGQRPQIALALATRASRAAGFSTLGP